MRGIAAATNGNEGTLRLQTDNTTDLSQAQITHIITAMESKRKLNTNNDMLAKQLPTL